MAKEIVSGIYKIEHVATGKFYVGSACSLESRLSKHKRDLNSNCHNNQHLQRAWNKYGADEFKFYLIEASRRAHIGMKFSPEVIAKRVATRAANAALHRAFQR